MTPLRVVQFGLGPIGMATVVATLEKARAGKLVLVGAIDIDPEMIGKDVGKLVGADATGIVVEANADEALARLSPDVVLHTTSSFLPGVVAQLEACARAKADVVSSTEELSFPHDRHPALSMRLDEIAKEHGVTFLGTGVNPGFAMDTLPLAATAPCLRVDRIRVEREVDAGLRRLPLQKKVGAGMTEEAFRERQKTGTFGHIGLVESLRMLASGLNWKLDAIRETLDPVIADRRIETPFLVVEPGQVAGIHHVANGIVCGSEVLTLDLRMFVGAQSPRDAVHVEGDPPIDLVVRGGIFGDTATVAALINAIPLVRNAQPGLTTMKDLPVPRAFGTG